MKVTLDTKLTPPFLGVYLFTKNDMDSGGIYRKYDGDWYSGEFELSRALNATRKVRSYVQKAVNLGDTRIFFHCDLEGKLGLPTTPFIPKQLDLF